MPVRSSVLVERVGELGALVGAVHRADEGRGHVLFVLGEAGIGKSRLVREALDARSQPRTVFAGRAVQGGGPYRPFASAFASTLRRHELSGTRELEPFRGVLGRLVPEWRQTEIDEEFAADVMLAEGVVRLLRSFAVDSAPVLVLEDLHWSDQESLHVVGYLADHLRSERAICIATIRTGEPSAAADLARDLARRDAAILVELGPLDEAGVRKMTSSCLGGALVPSEVDAYMADNSDGVPLFVEELLSGLEASGSLRPAPRGWLVTRPLTSELPSSLAGAVQARLAELDPTHRRIVVAAACLGRAFDWTLLPGATGCGEEDVLGAMQRTIELRLVEIDPGNEGQFRFRHGLTREAVLGHAIRPERTALAARLADAVEAAHPGLPGDWCERAAELAAVSGRAERAAELYLEAARRARQRQALATALAMLRSALRVALPDLHPLRIELELEEIDVLARAGDADGATRVGENLLVRLRSAGDTSRARVAALRLARAAIAGTRWDDARRHLDAAAVVDADDVDLVASAKLLTAQVAIGQGDVETAVEHARRTLDLASELDVPELICEALQLLGRAARMNDIEEAHTLFARALDLAEKHDLAAHAVDALHELGTIEMLKAARVDQLEAARRGALAIGAVGTAAIVDLQLAGTYAIRFQGDAAIEAAARCADVARALGMGLVLPSALAQAAAGHAVAGRRDEMETCIAEALDIAGDHADVHAVVWGHARATLSLLHDERERASSELDHAVSWARTAMLPGLFFGMRALMRTVDDRDGGSARKDCRSLPGIAGSINAALLGFADAVVEGRAGHHDAATASFRAADALLARRERLEGYRHLAVRLLAESALESGWGEPATWLRQALAFFDPTHTAIAAACRRLLASAGAVVPRRGRGDAVVPGSLRALGVTSREMDVLLLVRQGLTNSEIAERLHLSRRTVESHVANLLAKIGATSRTQLGAGGEEGVPGA